MSLFGYTTSIVCCLATCRAISAHGLCQCPCSQHKWCSIRLEHSLVVLVYSPPRIDVVARGAPVESHVFCMRAICGRYVHIPTRIGVAQQSACQLPLCCQAAGSGLQIPASAASQELVMLMDVVSAGGVPSYHMHGPNTLVPHRTAICQGPRISQRSCPLLCRATTVRGLVPQQLLLLPDLQAGDEFQCYICIPSESLTRTHHVLHATLQGSVGECDC